MPERLLLLGRPWIRACASALCCRLQCAPAWRECWRTVPFSCQHFHLLRLAAFRVGLPLSSFIGPGIPDIRAQKLFFRAASDFVFGFGAGALRFEPVSRLYLALPLAVRPAPLETGSFSPRPTDREVDLRGMVRTWSMQFVSRRL